MHLKNKITKKGDTITLASIMILDEIVHHDQMQYRYSWPNMECNFSYFIKTKLEMQLLQCGTNLGSALSEFNKFMHRICTKY